MRTKIIPPRGGDTMKWSDRVFDYCERGGDPAFWAEPVNAVSNLAIIVAGALALRLWRARSPAARGWAELGLIVAVFAIGVGSFLFHTLATRWAQLADTGPISIFMLAYLVYALRRYLDAGWRAVVAGVAAFVAAGVLATRLAPLAPMLPRGSVGYLPALVALVVVDALLWRRRHPAARHLGLAAILFPVALTLRSIDMSACPLALIQPGWRVGTHALWHILNAAVLHCFLTAALCCGTLRQKVIAH